MLETASTAVIALTGLYFITLAAAALVRPRRATSFLLGFAGSPRAHYVEMFVRLVVGTALVVRGPAMAFGEAFWWFGWVVLTTTALLLLIPWRWHHRFAQRVVPPAMRHIRWIGLVSSLLGGAFLAALVVGSAA